MDGVIKAIDGIYPATVFGAIKKENTNISLNDELLGNVKNISQDIKVSFSGISTDKDGLYVCLVFDLQEIVNLGLVDGEKYFNLSYTYEDANGNSSKVGSRLYVADHADINNTALSGNNDNCNIEVSPQGHIKVNRELMLKSVKDARYVKVAINVLQKDKDILVSGKIRNLKVTLGDINLTKYYIKIGNLWATPNTCENKVEFETNEFVRKSVIKTDFNCRSANAEIPLAIQTYEGGENKALHPKVVAFNTKWNGYKYWMAYTPYPNEDNENPCICASNDMLKWVTPNGLINPLDGTPEYGYNSDTHLVYNEIENILECWYRHAGNDNGVEKEIIYRKRSSDGINWGEKELLIESHGSLLKYICPSVIRENGKYVMWVGENRNLIVRYESENAKDWALINKSQSINSWHFDVIKTDLGYEYIGVVDNEKLIYSKSKDGYVWDDNIVILRKGVLGNFDCEKLYRPSFNKIDGKYYVFYSAWGLDRLEMGIGLSISQTNDIRTIKGITCEAKKYMSQF